MIPDLSEVLGAALREARERKGLSLRGAARLLAGHGLPSVDAQYLSKLERAKVTASMHRIQIIAEAYGITEAGELLG